MIEDAEDDAKSRKTAAEREINTMKEGAAAGAEQAKRDAVLSFKEEIQKQFERILAADVKKAMTEDSLGKLIRAALSGEDVSQYTAEVEEVSSGLKAELAEEIRNGLEIRPTKSVRAGFRLAAKDGSGYFDCTDEEIMQMLMPYFGNLNY